MAIFNPTSGYGGLYGSTYGSASQSPYGPTQNLYQGLAPSLGKQVGMMGSPQQHPGWGHKYRNLGGFLKPKSVFNPTGPVMGGVQPSSTMTGMGDPVATATGGLPAGMQPGWGLVGTPGLGPWNY